MENTDKINPNEKNGVISIIDLVLSNYSTVGPDCVIETSTTSINLWTFQYISYKRATYITQR